MSKLSDYEGRDLTERIQENLNRIKQITKSVGIKILIGDIEADIDEIETFFSDRVNEQENEIRKESKT